MSNFAKRLGLSLAVGYVLFYFGELVFWATSDRDGMTPPEMTMTWLVYAWFAYVLLAVATLFRAYNLWALFLAGAVFGWYEEGIVVQTMYGSADGVFPISIAFTGLAWHALIDVVVGCYLLPRAMSSPHWGRAVAAAAAVGAFYGCWAIWWWIEPPPAMQSLLAAGRTDIVFLHFVAFAFGTTIPLIVAYMVCSRMANFRFVPSVAEWSLLAGATLAYFVLVTMPAAPRAVWVLPPLMGITLLALECNRRSEPREFGWGQWCSATPPRRWLLLLVVPLVASGIYFAALAAGLRVPTNLVVYVVSSLAGTILWATSVVVLVWRYTSRPTR
jgi:hypothetical protein